VQTGFAPNSVLVELTGNAADPAVDPGGNIPDAIRVNGSGQVTIRIPRNSSHGRGYVVYGVPGPQGTLSLTGVSQTLEGGAPTAATNGTTRLADIDVITGNSFGVRLQTTPVTLPAPMGETNPVRDFEADGDQALLKIDGGMNLNNLPGVDVTNPGDASYGFEEFTDVRAPGYISDGMGGNVGTGSGLYEQQIDAAQLSEGRHFVTVRAFRRRATAGTPVFTDFKRTIYVDRLPPEAAIVSFDPFASAPNNPDNRDLIVRSVDGTADAVHVFRDLPANLSDAQILAMVAPGNRAGDYDRDAFVFGYTGVRTGNHVATVVTFEPTGNVNVQRFPGLFTDTNIGAGFGDLNGNGVWQSIDILGNNGFENILYSQNSLFNAAADVDGDGLITNLDLLSLGDVLTAGGAHPTALAAYDTLLVKRGDVNQDGVTNAADAAALYANFGASSWLMDLNVDGTLSLADVETLVSDLVRTSRGDFNLDRIVDGADFLIWQRNLGAADARFDLGDASLNGPVGADDLGIWRTTFGTVAPVSAVAVGAVPEPSGWMLIGMAIAAGQRAWRRPRPNGAGIHKMMHRMSSIIAAKTEMEFQPNSPGIHAGVALRASPAAARQGMPPTARGRGRIKPRTVSASARLRWIIAPFARPMEWAPTYPGVNAGALRPDRKPYLPPASSQLAELSPPVALARPSRSLNIVTQIPDHPAKRQRGRIEE